MTPSNEDVPDIAPAELKEQPKQPKKQSMTEFIQSHDNKQMVMQALEDAQKDEQAAQAQAQAQAQAAAISKRPQAMESSGTSSEDDGDSSDEAAKRAESFDVKTGISSATV